MRPYLPRSFIEGLNRVFGGSPARADKKFGSPGFTLRAGLRRPRGNWFGGNCDKRLPKLPKLNNPKFLRLSGLGGSWRGLGLLSLLVVKGMLELLLSTLSKLSGIVGLCPVKFPLNGSVLLFIALGFVLLAFELARRLEGW